VAEQIDEMQLYTLALKLHQEMNLGTFDECVAAARESKLNEAEAFAILTQK
jgi:hypothetical protein